MPTIARLSAGDELVLAPRRRSNRTCKHPPVALELLRYALLVHLEVELATTLARCGGTGHTRPVLADQANLAARYQRRLPLYRMAHISIPADALTPEQVVEAILDAAQLA